MSPCRTCNCEKMQYFFQSIDCLVINQIFVVLQSWSADYLWRSGGRTNCWICDCGILDTWDLLTCNNTIWSTPVVSHWMFKVCLHLDACVFVHWITNARYIVFNRNLCTLAPSCSPVEASSNLMNWKVGRFVGSQIIITLIFSGSLTWYWFTSLLSTIWGEN